MKKTKSVNILTLKIIVILKLEGVFAREDPFLFEFVRIDSRKKRYRESAMLLNGLLNATCPKTTRYKHRYLNTIS